ncbi:DUF4105 domain-containing protein [Alloalcanivorax xenomutans]|uniref:DUF4105 domain-containing protein n=1 Tax=Alloalcanivorax xenomutans TaxID=1094342 RepID=A0A9Q3W7F0_9GAMM|nr:DUF4105 domain-containing protein [Alloalcanivorax xenomutans]KYZ84514.1 hypothetical protein A3Q32_09340 [Alcanivorax sp. KX64203]MCE7509408.1 DUF4105 domain-containing protein [Alloalcanivorax xenomutans]
MRTGVLCALAGLFLILSDTVAAAQSREYLAREPRWQALLHINPGATLRDRHRSYVDDDNFFLSDTGKDDPLAELNASIEALRPAQAPERCRFPARYRFFAEHLGWEESAPFAHCDEYMEWRQSVQANRAVLVFPAAYLNSPSSMFGHTLLRLDQAGDGAVWLSWAVNFGAIPSTDDNSIFYIYRGLAGGYPGRFALVPYVQKIQEYSHMENRDIWEYDLTLNQEEIDWVIEHLWELKDINFDYYFFDENCSFRLLELVEVARPGTGLLDKWRFAELPVNTVRALDDKDLIEQRHYRPSKAQELEALVAEMTVAERRLSRRLADDPDLAQSAEFQAYPPPRQALMAQTAYRHVRFIHRKEARTEDVAKRSFALLGLMSRLPSTTPPSVQPQRPPEEGHGTKMLGVSGGQWGADDYGQLTWRMTYHDLLDNRRGFLDGAQIEGLGVTLRSTESQAVKLERLDLVSIRSLSPRDTFSKPLSWYVEGGLERAWAQGRRLTRYVQGGAGLSWRWQGWQPYMLLSARAENNSAFSTWITPGGGAEAGLLYNTGAWQWQLSSAGHYFTNDEYRHRSRFSAHYALGRQHGLRASLEREGWRGDSDTGFNLEWRWYYD